jgi:hypothetical protein
LFALSILSIYNYCFHMRWTSKVGFSGGDGNNLPKVDKLDVDLIWKVWVSEWVLLIAKSEICSIKVKDKDWLARNQNNVCEWGDMSIRRLLFQWVIKIQLSVLEKYNYRFSTHFWLSKVVIRVTTYCLSLHYISLGCSPSYLPRQHIFHYYFYIVECYVRCNNM